MLRLTRAQFPKYTKSSHNSITTTTAKTPRDFPGGPVVKNLPAKAGDVDSISGWGIKIPHASGQLSPSATTTEPTCSKERSV